MTAMPSLRSPPRPHTQPSAERSQQLDRRESELAHRERELSRAETELREREARVIAGERALDRRETEPHDVVAVETNVALFDRRTPEQIQALAVRVIRAGQKRRGELVDDPPVSRTEAQRLAERVIEAGKRRRGEID